MKKTLFLLVAVLSLGACSSASAIGISKSSLTNKVEESKKKRQKMQRTMQYQKQTKKQMMLLIQR